MDGRHAREIRVRELRFEARGRLPLFVRFGERKEAIAGRRSGPECPSQAIGDVRIGGLRPNIIRALKYTHFPGCNRLPTMSLGSVFLPWPSQKRGGTVVAAHSALPPDVQGAEYSGSDPL